MRREPARLGERVFDLLVVGGGIYGAWIAYDAALRGLSVAIVERDDWGSGTSSASSKLIHGGLRYLEHGHLGLVAKALRERARLLRLAPHRVWPLRFLLPVHGDSRQPRAVLKAGLMLYDLLAGGRPGLPGHRHLAADDVRQVAAWTEPTDLRGGFLFGDAGTDDARLTLELVDGALIHGAVAVNHAAVTRLVRRGDGAVAGAVVHDTRSRADHEVRATVTVAAVGPWALRLADCDPGPVRLSKGIHLVLPPLPAAPDQALLLTAPQDRRVFFLVPWYGATLVGTTDSDYHGDPDALRVEDGEIDYLLGAVRARCPGLGWTRADVRGSFAGVRTLQASRGQVGAATREWTLVEPAAGLLVPVGGKLTSARVEAARVVDRVLQCLGRLHPCTTAQRRLPWAPAGPWQDWLAEQCANAAALGIAPLMATTLARRHGVRVAGIWQRIRRDPTQARALDPRYPFCAAEVAHAYEHEMALTGEDLLRRRIPLEILARDRSRQISQELCGGPFPQD
ncbi:MAG: glycerol-3-phosphate dehydrogenase/oxidase [Planctomycetes bacterium]|nr:glycerol-3-phosphate dehydrogenase/oxidase [Planctomycetota bacterium]